MSALFVLFAVVVIARVLATWKLSTRRAADSTGASPGTRADRVLAA
ncbi:hypothetical protein [Embleya sp. NPDC050493]